MDVSATFTLSRRQLRIALRNAPVMRKMTIASALVIVFGLLKVLVDGKLGTFGYVCLAVLVLVQALGIPMAARRAATQMRGPWTVRITDTAYHLQTAVNQATVRLDAYREARLHRGFWYLTSPTGTSFFPAAVFTVHEQAQLAQLFAHRLPPRKKPWYRPYS
ncbi:hypothetical protein AB5J72_49535 [Streptomyces sp. CG1]|uniref:hypothetical protein n=1 Tax=Streptomyces sp. CG1 TaxID=1287523 RepID=UPI0034E1F878